MTELEATEMALEHSRAVKARISSITDTLLSFYDMKIDLAGLLGGMPLKDDEDDVGYFVRFLERIGFQSQSVPVKDLDLHSIDRPTLVETPSGEYGLVMPKKHYADGKFIFGIENEIDRQALYDNPYTGVTLVLEQQTESVGDYISHMKTGHSFDWFWQPIFNHRGKYFEILLASLFINTLVLVIPLYSMNIYDRVAINFVEETLYVLTLGVIIALVFDFVFKNIRIYILERLAEKLGNEFDFKLMERLMNIHQDKSALLTVGEQSNMFREMQSIRDFYASKLVPTIVDVPFIALYIGVIYYVGGTVAFITLATVIIIVLINMLSHYPISRIMEEYFSSIQHKSSYLIETLNGLSSIRMFNANSGRLFHWDRYLAKAARVSRHNNIVIAVLSNFSYLLSQACHVLIICVGVYAINEGTLTVGGLITCSIISARAVAPAMGFASIVSRWQQSESVLKAIDRFFQVPHFDNENLQKAPKGPFSGEIKMTNVNYAYPNQERLAISNINLTITPGTHIGVIGQSAAGKTTLAKLIGNVFMPSEGEITLDGIDINNIPHTELCRTITFAPQDSDFFRGSILQNITLGREDISKDAVEEACFISGLNLVLKQNAQGLDMEVGENGDNLSGGQKQALILARALARRPQILIFDEPTTGMDQSLESHVQHHLKAYIKDKTFIMITHRTSLLSLVDRLALIDKGRLVMEGPKQDVMNTVSGKKSSGKQTKMTYQ